MPQKNKTPAVKARLRDNQRRSRARQKEHIEDLQRRLREHEQRGIEATLVMQRVARAIALENVHLRALLTRRGVSDDEIEQLLRTEGVAPLVESQKISLSPRSHNQKPLGSSSDSSASVTSIIVFQQESTVNDDDGQGPHDYRGGGDDTRASAVVNHPPPTPTRTLNDARAAPCPKISSMETSCDAAATIIANVQGHGDKALALVALGCLGTKDCAVKNVEIFNHLDKID